MADQSLRFPPFTPNDHFMCCLCFELVHVEDCWIDPSGVKWDCCRPCGHNDMMCGFIIEVTRLLGHPYYLQDLTKARISSTKIY